MTRSKTEARQNPTNKEELLQVVSATLRGAV